MKAFAVLALCAASVAANGYGSSHAVVRVETPSYAAPVRTLSYGGSHEVRSSGYGGGYSSHSNVHIPITRFDNEIRGSESNSLRFDTGNGISVSDNTHVAHGRVSTYDDGYGNMVQSDATIVKEGHFSYTSPEGQHISTGWAADENGFRANGEHLPRPVEMPAEHAEAHREAHSRSSYSAPSYSHSHHQLRSSGY